jgi:hypothetical protein
MQVSVAMGKLGGHVAHRAIRSECHETTCRKEFLPTEAVAIGKAVMEAYKPVAEERQTKEAAKHGSEGGRGKKKTHRGSSPKGKKQDESARTTSVAAAAVGMGYEQDNGDRHEQCDPDPPKKRIRKVLSAT